MQNNYYPMKPVRHKFLQEAQDYLKYCDYSLAALLNIYILKYGRIYKYMTCTEEYWFANRKLFK